LQLDRLCSCFHVLNPVSVPLIRNTLCLGSEEARAVDTNRSQIADGELRER
jgi:hypothetical protein